MPLPAPLSWAALPWKLDFSFFALLFVAGGASAIRVFGSWHAQQQRLQAELQLLKAQLQPAFLFAILGTLHSLTRQQSPAAPGAVLPLADGLAMLRHYVALEQLRLPRLKVSLSFSVAAARTAQFIRVSWLHNAQKETRIRGCVKSAE